MIIDADLFDYQFTATFWYYPENDPSGSTVLLLPTDIEDSFRTETRAHPFRTDRRGCDVFARLVYGIHIVVQVGLIVTGIGITTGTVTGVVSDYYGGWVDDVLQRSVESLYAIPFLILVVAIMPVFGRELGITIIGVSTTTTSVFTRLIRSQVLSVREMEYIEAAKAADVRDRHIVPRRITPNSFAPMSVQPTFRVGANILTVVSLSLLGFGIRPPASL